MSAAAPTVRVRTLLGRRDLELALRCWKTLQACSADAFETVVHEDGSLTDADVARLERELPRRRVVQGRR